MNQKKAVSKIGIAYALYIITAILLSTLISLGIRNFADSSVISSNNFRLIVGTVPSYIFAFTLTWFIIRKIPKMPPDPKKITCSWFFMLIPISFAAMYIGAFIGLGAGSLLNLIPNVNITNSTSDIIMKSNLFLVLLIVVIVGPIFEELLFRKFLLDRLRPISAHVGLALSAVMFGLFHENVYQFFYAVLLGLILGSIYLNTGRIRYTIFIHMTINFFGSFFPILLQKINGGNNSTYIFGLFIILMIFTGIIMFCINIKAFKVEEVQWSVPYGSRFKTIFLAPGMFLFYLVSIASFILTIFMK